MGTGDCGVVQNLPVANSQCGNASGQPDTAAWDDSPWVTAVGGSIPNIDPTTGAKRGTDPVWHSGIFSEGAGYSSVFSRPDYQKGVAGITRPGFDVATGWGTINGNFVPSLVAATRANGQEAQARHQASYDLAALQHGIQFTPPGIGPDGMTYMLAGGFLPGHPVQMSIDGTQIATLTVGDLGTVTYMIDPSQLSLAPGQHTVQLDSLLLTMTGSFWIS